MNVLVIAPHPDDEILGVGGTIAKRANDGDNVYVCVVIEVMQLLTARGLCEFDDVLHNMIGAVICI